MDKPHVLLLLKGIDHLAYEGIIAYARENGWKMQLYYVAYHTVPEKWQGTGIISHAGNDPEIIGLIHRCGVCTVDIGNPSDQLKVPQVLPDNQAIGAMAARYLMDKGFRNLGFFPYRTDIDQFPGHLERARSFQECVIEGGGTFTPIRGKGLLKQLEKLPKPFAILANNDMDGLRLMSYCHELGIRVPEEIAILGVGNNPDFCDLARTPLSSVDANGREIGIQAARLLDRLMAGDPPPEEPIRVPPVSVVTRQSTDILAIPHLPTARALRYLIAHYRDPNLSFDRIPQHVGLSRQNLDLAFKRFLGHSMFEHLEKIRLEKAVDLLNKPGFDTYKGYEIAAMCGFSNVDHLSRALKKHLGKSLRQMRRK